LLPPSLTLPRKGGRGSAAAGIAVSFHPLAVCG
jgi:hypothetical protein